MELFVQLVDFEFSFQVFYVVVFHTTTVPNHLAVPAYGNRCLLGVDGSEGNPV